MRTAALLHAGALTPHALVPLASGPSAWDRAISFTEGLVGAESLLVLEGSLSLPAGAGSRVQRGRWTVPALLEEASRFVARLELDGGGPVEALVVAQGDEPLLDPGLAALIMEDYRRYRADYAFADGYPMGLAIEVIHPRIIPALQALCGASGSLGTSPAPEPLPERGWLFKLIQKDINAFDIETRISPKDLRELRLDLACDTKRNSLLVGRLIEAGVRDAASALELIPARLDLLRTLPAFVQVQVSGACPQACALCPWPAMSLASGSGEVTARRDFMPRERFAALMDQVAAFCGDAVIDISLWGEPSLHPDIEGLVEEVLSRPGLSLIIETSGIGWRPGAFARLAARWPERLHWVVSLDAAGEALYRALRGEGFAEAQAAARELLALFPTSAHVQLVRARDNEAELEEFWRSWKALTDNVIIQKYSRFAGFLPARKVTDLSPLARRPCWHVKRDLAILVDGSVHLCRECARGEIPLGNVFERGLPAVWNEGEAWHARHVAGDWPDPCKDCDEYYTYNA